MFKKKQKISMLLISMLLVITSIPVTAADETVTDSSMETSSEEELTKNENTDIEDSEQKKAPVEEQSNSKEESKEQNFSEKPLEEEISLSDYEIRLKEEQEKYTYTGKEIRPEIKVIAKVPDENNNTAQTEELLEDIYYDVSYEDNINVGEGKIILTGKNGCTGTESITFQILPVSLSACKYQIVKTMEYTGKSLKPAVNMTLGTYRLTAGKDYTVTYLNNKAIGSASVVLNGHGNFTGSVKLGFSIKLGTPKVKVSSSYSKNKVSWTKVKGANVYKVYRSTSQKGKYKLVKKYTSGSKVSYSDTKAKFGKTYYYKVKAYRKTKVKNKTKVIYGTSSAALKGKRVLGKVTMKSAKASSNTSAKVTWKKVTGAQGYKVYKSTEKDGTYQYAGKVKGKTSLTVKKLRSGVQYYFKVKAYRKSNGKVYYGKVSEGKKESIPDNQRLNYLFPKGVPTSKATMELYLVTITVPIKDHKGVPSTMQLRVHKKLEQNFRKAFQEMYRIGFPVRAEDTDTYNWRSMASGKNRSHHSYGCVADVNWNSNPMIGVTEGKYRPGVDPYSVTPEVVAIWKKCGFYWGGNWRSTKDYMHFSYTNH